MHMEILKSKLYRKAGHKYGSFFSSGAIYGVCGVDVMQTLTAGGGEREGWGCLRWDFNP